MREVVVEGDEVVGIRGGPRTATTTERATVVIGADGPKSAVARRVDAPQYDPRPIAQVTAWTYWSGLPMDAFEGYPRDWRMAYGWPTEDGLVLVGVNWPIADYRRLGSDTETEYLRVLDVCAPDLARRVREGSREEPWYRGSCGGVLRRPYGPGWALVGDAGYAKDPCTAQGIADAFRDAELLAAALDEGLSGRQPLQEALADYEGRRNEVARPYYEFTAELAKFAPPPAEFAALLGALQGNPVQISRFLGLFAQTVSPVDFFAPESVQEILAQAG